MNRYLSPGLLFSCSAVDLAMGGSFFSLPRAVVALDAAVVVDEAGAGVAAAGATSF